MRISRRIAILGLGVFAACTPSSRPPEATATTTTANTDVLTSPLDAATRAGLLAFRDSVWYAWFAGDTAFLRQALPADFLSIPFGDDPTWANRDETIAGSARYAASGGKMTKLEFPRTEVQVSGNTALILTSFSMELENGGTRSTIKGRATEFFVRKDGKWSHPSWHLDSGQ